jgi:hypothetical protein
MDKKPFAPQKLFVPIFIAFMGLAAVTNAAGSPGFAALRTVDVVRLMASGMCFGAAVASLVIFFGPGLH